ncbi:MAG: lipoyl(octanoyl) transferase LipB [Myxococcota bacterium]|nr:lipoyl(octanoyl) transferase LipB [Myxococcota bacterium]
MSRQENASAGESRSSKPDGAGPSCRPRRTLRIERWGRLAYAAALDRQMAAVRKRIEGQGHDTLFLVEHPTVVTLGRSFREEHLLVSREALAERGVEVHSIARGGDVTLHTPGQLVGYLVMDLRARQEADLHAFVRRIEASLIKALEALDLSAARVPGRTGVFMRDPSPKGSSALSRKVASIGIGVKRWVSFHGFGLNVTADLQNFKNIVPCGLGDVEMTSVEQELLCGPLGLDQRVREAVEQAFLCEFSVDS